MSGVLKTQIIKLLSRFAKNLSTKQVNFSTFKGECELTNIQLDENAIMDALKLPGWLTITKAICLHVFVKIAWMSIKSTPIFVQLSNVIIEVRTQETFHIRNPSSYIVRGMSGYGIAQKIVEGATVSIQNLEIFFHSNSLTAHLELPSVDLFSCTPVWKPSAKLYNTRLSNSTTKETLVFKMAECPTLKIEANSKEFTKNTVLKFIANHVQIRATIKRCSTDGKLLTAKILFSVDDLLSVTSDLQLKAAIISMKEMFTLMLKCFDEEKKYKKTEQSDSSQSNLGSAISSSPVAEKPPINHPLTDLQPIFRNYDVAETSFHLKVCRTDLHFISDQDRSAFLVDSSGSIMIRLNEMSVDHYPYHKFGSLKLHWLHQSSSLKDRDDWAEKLVNGFEQGLGITKNLSADETTEGVLKNSLMKLLEYSFVFSLKEVVVYQLAKAAQTKAECERIFFKILTGSHHHCMQLIFTQYYYPGDSSARVPNPNIFISLSSLKFNFDEETILWLLSYLYATAANDLLRNVEMNSGLMSGCLCEHYDVIFRMDLIETHVHSQKKFENLFQFSLSVCDIEIKNCGENRPKNDELIKLRNEKIVEYLEFVESTNEFSLRLEDIWKIYVDKLFIKSCNVELPFVNISDVSLYFFYTQNYNLIGRLENCIDLLICTNEQVQLLYEIYTRVQKCYLDSSVLFHSSSDEYTLEINVFLDCFQIGVLTHSSCALTSANTHPLFEENKSSSHNATPCLNTPLLHSPLQRAPSILSSKTLDFDETMSISDDLDFKFDLNCIDRSDVVSNLSSVRSKSISTLTSDGACSQTIADVVLVCIRDTLVFSLATSNSLSVAALLTACTVSEHSGCDLLNLHEITTEKITNGCVPFAEFRYFTDDSDVSGCVTGLIRDLDFNISSDCLSTLYSKMYIDSDDESLPLKILVQRISCTLTQPDQLPVPVLLSNISVHRNSEGQLFVTGQSGLHVNNFTSTKEKSGNADVTQTSIDFLISENIRLNDEIMRLTEELKSLKK